MTTTTSWHLPPVKNGAHIGLLGGSFDPPHIGHQLLALSFIALEPIDELWIMPCANHAKKATLTSFCHRFAMGEIAFRRMRRVRVIDIEHHLPPPNYTLQTLEAILNVNPTLSLHFGIGSDLVSSFSSWHAAAQIVLKARIVIFERYSYPLTTLPTLLKDARLHRGYPLPDINSTSLRDFSRRQKIGNSLAFVDQDVVRYVEKHGIYRSI